MANYKGQVQAWALNRYVYQAAIRRKDASLNCDVHRRDLECLGQGRGSSSLSTPWDACVLCVLVWHLMG
jgi:hypothetical protein